MTEIEVLQDGHDIEKSVSEIQKVLKCFCRWERIYLIMWLLCPSAFETFIFLPLYFELRSISNSF